MKSLHIFLRKFHMSRLKIEEWSYLFLGGLDSRTQATALRGYKDVYAYSYKFKNGLNETGYGAAVAKAQNFKYKAFEIQPSYLWDVIEELADINKCFSEFTHPRQMSIHHLFKEMGDIFYLGHWGDVLFDDMGVPSDMGNEELVKILYKPKGIKETFLFPKKKAVSISSFIVMILSAK